jgi:ribonucleoside-diphosphate reductase beta chain
MADEEFRQARFDASIFSRRDVGPGLIRRSFWPGFFSRVASRLQWDARVIDLTADATAWAALPDERRARLTTLLSGFCVAEDAVAEHLLPFRDASKRSSMASDEDLMAWVFFLQRRDEIRHAAFFDRVAAEVLKLPGDTVEERREAARADTPPAMLELFEHRLPAVAGELAEERSELAAGVGLYHMILEGIVFSAGQAALLDDLDDGVLPGVREGVHRIELDERWHVGFGLRCLIECKPSEDTLEELVARAEQATAAWGDAVPAGTREHAHRMFARRLRVAHLTDAHAATEARVARDAQAA